MFKSEIASKERELLGLFSDECLYESFKTSANP